MTPDDIATIDAAMRIIARYAGYGIAIHLSRNGGSIHFVATNIGGRRTETSTGLIDCTHAPTPGDAFADLARRLDQ
jgi:hypothetical protein